MTQHMHKPKRNLSRRLDAIVVGDLGEPTGIGHSAFARCACPAASFQPASRGASWNRVHRVASLQDQLLAVAICDCLCV